MKVSMSKHLTSIVVVLVLIITLIPTNIVFANSITDFMTTTYNQALKLYGGSSFNGYCGACVGRQLQALGVNTSYVGANGNATYDAYANMGTTSGGYKVNSFSSSSYSLNDLLNHVNNNNPSGGYTYIALGFHTGSSSSAGQQYGHTLLIYSVNGGTVYFTESWGTSIRSQSISDFCYSYRNYTTGSANVYNYEGAIWFTKGDIQPIEPPTTVGMVLDYENMTINPNTTVKFSYWATNATSFDIEIKKDGSTVETYTNVSNPFYYTPTAEGNYEAYGYARNSAGSTFANCRKFCAKWVDAPPSGGAYIGMTCNYEYQTINPGTEVEFNYWATNITAFDIVVERDGIECDRYTDVSSPFHYTPTVEGEYAVYGYGRNTAGSTLANKRTFTVKYTEAPPSGGVYIGMTCNYEYQTINPGTQVDFNYWATNITAFDIVVERDGIECDRYTDVSSPFHYTPTVEGEYAVYGYGRNPIGSTLANKRTFIVKSTEAPPSGGAYIGMICNYEYQTIAPDTEVTFSYWATNVSTFDIVIEKDGKEYANYTNVTNPFCYTPKEEGNYAVYGYGRNSVGSTLANRRTFTVKYTEAPPSGGENIGMTCDREHQTIEPGTKVAFNYWAKNTTSFDIVIERNGEEYTRYSNVSNPFYFTPTVDGDYAVYGYGTNSAGSTLANKRTFHVKSSESTQNPTPTPSVEPATDGATVKVSSATAAAGKTVNVTVDLSGNKGFANLGLQVGYDASVLTLTSATNSSSVGATYTAAQNITANPYNMGWDSTNNVSHNGTLATLTFKVNDNAADGIYPITVSHYKGIGGNYTDGEDVNYDADFKSLGLNYVNGAITVSSHIAGDINGDGKVNNQDGTFLLRHLAGWNVNIDESALDVNGDSKINNQDGTVLLRYLAGWSVTIH